MLTTNRYKDIIESLKAKLEKEPGDRWSKALEVLGWVVCAKRPLTYYELQGILSFNADEQTMDMDLNMLRHEVEDMLGSLVHVVPGHGVDLIHETAGR